MSGCGGKAGEFPIWEPLASGNVSKFSIQILGQDEDTCTANKCTICPIAKWTKPNTKEQEQNQPILFASDEDVNHDLLRVFISDIPKFRDGRFR